MRGIVSAPVARVKKNLERIPGVLQKINAL
jgi:hypothetical protein